MRKKIEQLHNNHLNWQSTSALVKKAWLNSLAENLIQNKDTIALAISNDMGKPITESLNEVQKCIDCCYHFENQLPTILSAMETKQGRYFPIGTILAIMPWNFPLWQLIRCIVPAICVGNTVLIKPALNAIETTITLTKLCPEPAIFDATYLTDERTASLIQHPKIAGVSFTGSVQAGKAVGSLSTQNLKPCVLELGGSDPFIVFEDADISEAVSHGFSARFSNNGQTCISAKRFLVQESRFEEAIQLMTAIAKKRLTYGSPLNASTTFGPMARLDLKDHLRQQITSANIPNDAIRYQYEPNNQMGYFISPMIVDGRHLSESNPLFKEEIFGPIAIFNSFTSIEDAIEKANATEFGLGASIWSNNHQTLSECCEKINCGSIALNKNVHSAFDTPFGGWKASGLGLELGIEGCLSFTNFKAIQQKL